AARASAEGVRTVEYDQRRMRCGAPEKGVDPAAVSVRAGARLPFATELAKVHYAARLRRKDTWPANFFVEQPACLEADIADDLGIKPKPGLPCKQFVVWIDVGQL